MSRTALAPMLAAAALVACGPACHHSRVPGEPHTQVQVFNQCRETVTLAGKGLPYWTSWAEYVVHGESDSLTLSDSAGSLGTLVITSLVPSSDPNDYFAAVNLRESVPGRPYAIEYCPAIEAVVIGGTR